MSPYSSLTSVKRRIRGLLLGSLLALATAEGTLRIAGFPERVIPGAQGMQGAFLPDATLGWKHMPGTYTFKGALDRQEPFRVTFTEDGARATSALPRVGGAPLLLLGCSFTEGFGLNDADTFAWKLQIKMPEYAVINGGVSGYGTIHALLALQRFLESPRRQTGMVVYAFAEFHESRNIKNPLVQQYHGEDSVYPFCTMDSCNRWSGKRGWEALASVRVVALLQRLWDTLSLNLRTSGAEQITVRLMKEMKLSAEQSGMRFIVAPVTRIDSSRREQFDRAGLSSIDCVTDEMSGAEYHLTDGHPNAAWNERFSDCLARELGAREL